MLPIYQNKAFKSDTQTFPLLVEGYTKTSYAIKAHEEWYRPINLKIMVSSNLFTLYREQPRFTRTVLAYTHGRHSRHQSGQKILPSVLINDSKFLKLMPYRNEENCVVPWPTPVKALSWCSWRTSQLPSVQSWLSLKNAPGTHNHPRCHAF